jgi:2-polyprenyl-3-methyl-5-hydroxy-6-metoxy-1,4-benzoquinol methylase
MGQEWWEWRYKSGHWEDLNALLEFAHYSIIAGYLRCSITSGIVLDVGCGEGVLFDYLHPKCVRQYFGIDWSPTAVANAARRSPRISVACHDFETYEPPRGLVFDAIVFNEVLYYAESPVQLVDRYSAFLSPRGVFVISMYEGSEPDPAHEERVQEIWGATASPPWMVLDEVHASSPAASVSWYVRLLGRRDRQSLSEMNEIQHSKLHERRRIAGHSG